MTHSDLVTRGLGSAACAAVATTVAIAISGRQEGVSMWAPFNAVSHIAWGDEAALHVEPSWKYSATGIGLNAAAMLLWGAVFTGIAGRETRSTSRAVVAGMATAATAYVVDYHLVPERLTPGFEKRLSGGSMFFIYASLAVGLSAGHMLTGGLEP